MANPEDMYQCQTVNCGYIYNPEYISLWSDNEFTDVSKALNKVTYFEDVVIKHEHPMWSGSAHDRLYQRNDKYFMRDKATYLRRKANGFKHTDTHH